MHNQTRFYEKLHANDLAYGQGSYDVGRLIAASAFQRWINRIDKCQVRILDVGCGKGQFLLDLSESLRSGFQLCCSRLAGIDLVRSDNNLLDKISPRPEFFQQS